MINNNFIDYRNITRNTPLFFNMIKPKKSIGSTLLSAKSLQNINSFIDNAQKIVNVYNQALPIIEQTKPMINNIKTTFNVMKAFKKISKEDSLENMFDKLPDYEDNKIVKEKEEKTEALKSNVANPFYP